MNLFRQQMPYVFRPPRYTPWLAPVLRTVAEHMRRAHNVRTVQVQGMKAVAERQRDGCPLLVAPNHADHADPSVLVHAAGRAGLTFHFMAAREGFERNALSRFVLQRMGAFSIDREGTDIAAIKMALQILAEGRFPLVIFPEGEIYHHHEWLDELNEGVATIALRAARKAGARPCHIVPTSLRYTHAAGIEETFPARVERLEQRITWKPHPHRDTRDRLARLGRGLLAVKEEEWLGQAQQGTLAERILALQHALVAQVDERHGIAAAPERRIPERVKTLRARIRARLTDPEAKLSGQETWDLYDDLDRLFGAVQLYSYPGRYLEENPSPDRIAETILKLEEDVLGKGTYPVPRTAHLQFDEPIDVAAFLAQRGLDAKSGVQPLTRHIAERIQAMLG